MTDQAQAHLSFERLVAAGSQAFSEAQTIAFEALVAAVLRDAAPVAVDSVRSGLEGLVVSRDGSVSLEEWARFAAA